MLFTHAFIPPSHYSPSSYYNNNNGRTYMKPLMVSGQRAHTPPPPKSRRRKLQPKPRSPKQKSSIPISEAKSMGEAIQLAQTIADHLSIVEKFVWLPLDDNLQPHLLTQLVHHEKRRRWGSQLLDGLGQAALSGWEENPLELKHKLLSLEGDECKIWNDARLVRAIMSVALSMQNDSTDINRPEKEGVWIAAALKGLHVLSGCIAPLSPSPSSSAEELQLWIDLHRGISMLIQTADGLSESIPLSDAIELRWAIRGLSKRLQLANTGLAATTMEDNPSNILLDFIAPKLNDRTSKLPFDIFSHCLPWQMSSTDSNNHYFGYPTQDLLPTLLNSIPFNFDILTTRTGESVIERRGTSWLAEDGIGALAYSGKLMSPAVIGSDVRNIMRDMEKFCVEQEDNQQSLSQALHTPSSNVEIKWDTTHPLAYEGLGKFLEDDTTFFDCALCNHYPDENSACKFHTDPEHGSLWHTTTTVVSCGMSRKFAFRPIPEVSSWTEWDNTPRQGQNNDNSPATLQLFPGDVVFMIDSCNDLFHHAVYSSSFDKIEMNNSRVSLVFKRALDRKGKKGHSLKGEGRRSRQRNNI